MTAGPRRDTKWWGWGDPAVNSKLDSAALGVLRERLGELRAGPVPIPLEDFELPPAEPLPSSLIAAIGADNIFSGAEDRLRHATGRGYIDLARLRQGRLSDAPDAVICPPSADAVSRILELCAAEGVAVVPFGGGTSVVGGIEPLRGSHPRLISLDLRRLDQVVVDPRSLTARLGAGLRGPQAERALSAHGLTLGHFPQSFQYATIGGFAATRSAGQASSGYGRFDAMVTSIRLLAPAGELQTRETPHSAAGPALRELVLGSEGTFGVIPDVTVRVRAAPEQRHYEGWFAESFACGCEIVRSMAQGSGLPDVIRISDEEETEGTLALSGPRGFRGALLDRYLGLRRRRGGALIIVGLEGERESVARRRALAARALHAGGAIQLGQTAGRSWDRHRYQGPYLRDTLIDMGAMVETLETAHSWTELQELHTTLRATLHSSLAAQGTPGIVFCHLSHAYRDGASLYFTFIAPARRGEEIEQWQALKRAASEAIIAAGATITHHHGVGRDHARYLESELGSSGLQILAAVRDRLDPTEIMNPGKLLG